MFLNTEFVALKHFSKVYGVQPDQREDYSYDGRMLSSRPDSAVPFWRLPRPEPRR